MINFRHLSIRCARCGRAVDRWEVDFDNYDDSYIVRAWCHGAVDRCTIDRFTAQSWVRGAHIVEAVAFRDRPALDNPQPPAAASGRALIRAAVLPRADGSTSA